MPQSSDGSSIQAQRATKKGATRFCALLYCPGLRLYAHIAERRRFAKVGELHARGFVVVSWPDWTLARGRRSPFTGNPPWQLLSFSLLSSSSFYSRRILLSLSLSLWTLYIYSRAAPSSLSLLHCFALVAPRRPARTNASRLFARPALGAAACSVADNRLRHC